MDKRVEVTEQLDVCHQGLSFGQFGKVQWFVISFVQQMMQDEKTTFIWFTMTECEARELFIRVVKSLQAFKHEAYLKNNCVLIGGKRLLFRSVETNAKGYDFKEVSEWKVL